MPKPLLRYYVAASLDGFIATSDGAVDWLAPYEGQDFGYKEFVADIDTVILGRATYDQVRGFGKWPYGGTQGYVLTSKALPSPPDDVRAYNGDLADLAARLRTECKQDIWIVGGGQTAAGFLEADALDLIELFVMPVLLGTGIPFLPNHTRQTELRLIGSETGPLDVQKLTYSIERAGP